MTPLQEYPGLETEQGTGLAQGKETEAAHPPFVAGIKADGGQ